MATKDHNSPADQRRMVQAITHSFPSNAWRSRISKGKESDRCDLCKALWVAQNRFTTDSVLHEQTLGHLQHTCEALRDVHTMAHHRCWRLIHGELSRLASAKWNSKKKRTSEQYGQNWHTTIQKYTTCAQHNAYGWQRKREKWTASLQKQKRRC